MAVRNVSGSGLIDRHCVAAVAVACLLVAATLQGCSAGKSRRRADQRTVAVEQSLSTVRDIQADHTAEIAALQSELREIRGLLEELKYAQRTNVEQGLGELKSQLSYLRRRVPPPAIVPVRALEDDEVEAARLARAAHTSQVGVPYVEGLDAIREGRFAEAIAKLDPALEFSQTDPWTANLLFWIGISHDGLNDFPNAVRALNASTSKFPRHARTPLALLRLSSVFVKLKDLSAAKLTLQKLTVEHPASEEAKLAKLRLKDFR